MAQPPIKKGAIDTGTGADQIVALDGSGNLPAIDGSNVTGVDAASVQGRTVGAGANQLVLRDGAGDIDADTLNGQSDYLRPSSSVFITGIWEFTPQQIFANGMRVGKNGNGDSEIVFYDDNSNTERTLKWDDSDNEFQVEDNTGTLQTLLHTGNVGAFAGRNGAVVSRSSNFLVGNNTYTVINWDQESYDDNSHHDNVTNSNQLVVPAGVSRVRLKAHVAFTSDVAGQRVIQIRKNGGFGTIGTNIPMPSYWVRANDIPTLAITTIDAETPIVDVTPGDYFEVRAGVWNAGASLNVLTESWFSIEVIE